MKVKYNTKNNNPRITNEMTKVDAEKYCVLLEQQKAGFKDIKIVE